MSEINTDIFDEETKNFVSTYKNPFNQDKIKRIVISINVKTNFLYDNPFEATVYFNNGDTNGNHDIKADSLPDLLTMIEIFIKSL